MKKKGTSLSLVTLAQVDPSATLVCKVTYTLKATGYFLAHDDGSVAHRWAQEQRRNCKGKRKEGWRNTWPVTTILWYIFMKHICGRTKNSFQCGFGVSCSNVLHRYQHCVMEIISEITEAEKWIFFNEITSRQHHNFINSGHLALLTQLRIHVKIWWLDAVRTNPLPSCMHAHYMGYNNSEPTQ